MCLMKRTLCLLALATTLSAPVVAAAKPMEFHVAVNGSDTNPGTRRAPFATWECARDAIRARRATAGLPAGGVTVLIHRGDYPFATSFTLTAEDSGTTDSPILYRAFRQDEVRLIGGRGLAAKDFAVVTNAADLARLDAGARRHVRVAGLPELGFANLGAFPDQFSGAALVPELFFNDQRMTLARWPNVGWAEFHQVIESGPAPWRNHASDKLGAFTYEGDRPTRWLQAPAVWLQGYWCFDWASETIRIGKINPAEQRITLARNHGYGLGGGNPGPRRFFALNLLEELDQPGEYFIDRASNRLFFWPPAVLKGARMILSTLRQPVISLSNVTHVSLQGLTVETCVGDAIQINGGSDSRIIDCRVRNTGMAGIVVAGGARHRVEGCDIFETGTSGLKMGGGDRKTLTSCGHEAVNNHIYNVSRRQRTHAYHVHLSGVGVRLAHNLLHDGPHQAIGLAGNDHLIEFNEIHHTGMETDDCGAFYMGRNPSERGSVLRYNFWHHIGSQRTHGSCAVYFDDGAGGQTVFGNVFYRAAGGSFGAVFSHGGHDNIVRNCVFIDCPLALGSSPWPDAHWREWLEGELWQTKLRRDVDITQPPFADRYPEARRLLEFDGAPRRNYATDNVIVNCDAVQTGNWELRDNLVTDQDPGFVDAQQLNFQLRRDASVFKKLPGFEPIPFAEIGLQRGGRTRR